MYILPLFQLKSYVVAEKVLAVCIGLCEQEQFFGGFIFIAKRRKYGVSCAVQIING